MKTFGRTFVLDAEVTIRAVAVSRYRSRGIATVYKTSIKGENEL